MWRRARASNRTREETARNAAIHGGRDRRRTPPRQLPRQPHAAPRRTNSTVGQVVATEQPRGRSFQRPPASIGCVTPEPPAVARTTPPHEPTNACKQRIRSRIVQAAVDCPGRSAQPPERSHSQSPAQAVTPRADAGNRSALRRGTGLAWKSRSSLAESATLVYHAKPVRSPEPHRLPGLSYLTRLPTTTPPTPQTATRALTASDEPPQYRTTPR